MKKIMLFLLLLTLITGIASADEDIPAPDPDLLRLQLIRTGEMMPQNYSVYAFGDAYYLYRNEELPIRLDPEAADEIVSFIEGYDVRAWDGFKGSYDESDLVVLDGEKFSFSAALTDGTVIRAEGDNVFPENYSAVVGLITDRLERAKGKPIEEDICGTYIYEEEGLGGDFRITINEDETYTFSEGLLSSYMGGGSWYGERGGFTFFEENGLDLVNHFAAGNGVLVFIAAESDNFPYIQLPDGGKFFRQ